MAFRKGRTIFSPTLGKYGRCPQVNLADDLKKYPEIALKWNEPGIAFRVTFIKKDFKLQQELQQELQHELQHELQQELQHELQHESLYTQVIKIIATKTAGTRDISVELKQKSISGHLKKIIAKLLEQHLIEWTIPETPKSSKQQYKITDRGIAFLQLLHKNRK